MFRTMGLRHLTVINRHNHVVGMITRKDLMTFNIEEKLIHKAKEELAEEMDQELDSIYNGTTTTTTKNVNGRIVSIHESIMEENGVEDEESRHSVKVDLPALANYTPTPKKMDTPLWFIILVQKSYCDTQNNRDVYKAYILWHFSSPNPFTDNKYVYIECEM